LTPIQLLAHLRARLRGLIHRDAVAGEIREELEFHVRMRAEDYEGALPLLEQAVSQLAGSGSLAEAYASYNLAFTRLALGSCDGVLELLDRSEEVQGDRSEIDRLRREAEKQCREGPGKGNGKKKEQDD